MIQTLLIANRGEIASRVIRTAKQLGIFTVAIHSDPDAGAPFVREADEAVPIGGRTPAESYLKAATVIEAAISAGADTLHPGYGFLSENPGFAQQVLDAGLTWVGPTPQAIAAMGSKLSAREIMEKAGVPVLPGRDLTGVPTQEMKEHADKVGWPVLIKASAGGGGRGMRLVRDPTELGIAVEAARRESESAFGDPTVFVEHYIDNPRHVEIQIFGDHHGNLVHLFERECSIQRRHQKILEEAPSPALDEDLRRLIGEAAVLAGRAIGYTSAGTVEFVLAPDGQFFFLEVNTRLQVEHPVTEEATGLDLVALQLAVAEGRPLPPEALQATLHRHAIEARVYAEDPLAGFLPVAGRLRRFEFDQIPGIRVETGAESGDVVTPNYDPMLAKVIAVASTRHDSLRKLAAALRTARIQGITTNRDLLVGILEHEDFIAGNFDTHFLERHPPSDLFPSMNEEDVWWHCLAAALAEQSADRGRDSVWPVAPSGWRNNRSSPQTRSYVRGDTAVDVSYSLGKPQEFRINGNTVDVTLITASPNEVEIAVRGVRRRFQVDVDGGRAWVSSRRGNVELEIKPRFPKPAVDMAPGSLSAPMPGMVVRVEVTEGDRVQAGQPLLYLEAMKMEHPVVAPAAGVVTQVRVAAGSAVDIGTVLAVIDEKDEDVGGPE